MDESLLTPEGMARELAQAREYPPDYRRRMALHDINRRFLAAKVTHSYKTILVADAERLLHVAFEEVQLYG